MTGSTTKAPTQTHIVKKGEYLDQIANRYGMTLDELYALNKIDRNRQYIYPNEGVKIIDNRPQAVREADPLPYVNQQIQEYTVQPGDGYFKIAQKFNMNPAELMELNGKKAFWEDLIHPNDTLLVIDRNHAQKLLAKTSNEQQSSTGGCPLNQEIAIFPVRYAIDEAPTNNKKEKSKHPIPKDWGTTGLPEIKTRGYTMRQLRDGWVYVWDGEKFDEYKVKGTEFKHTNRQDKKIEATPIVQIEPTEGEKGTKKYLGYSSDKTLHICYAQERWTELLYEKMLNNEKGQRTQWMRPLDLTKLCLGIQPHTQLLTKIADYVADIYEDKVNLKDNYQSTTVHTRKSSNQDAEIKPAITSAQIVAAVPEKESAYFLALDDMLGVVNDLTLQAVGRHMELASFNKNYEHKLFVAEIVESLCSANIEEDEYPASCTSSGKKRRMLNALEASFEQIKDAAYKRHASAGFDAPLDKNYFATECAKAAWNGDRYANGLMFAYSPLPLPLEFKANYGGTKEWYAEKFSTWIGRDVSRFQVKYDQAIAFLDNKDTQKSLQRHVENAVKDLIKWLSFIGNNPNKIYLDPTDKSHCEILLTSFTTVQEQLCAIPDATKEWLAQDLIDKKTLVSLIPYNFTVEWANKFEDMIKYYLLHGKLEENESDFDIAGLTSKLLAGGNAANSTEAGLGGLGQLYKSWVANPSSQTAGTNTIPVFTLPTGENTSTTTSDQRGVATTGQETTTPTSDQRGLSTTGQTGNSTTVATQNSPRSASSISHAVAKTHSPSQIFNNRVAQIITFERVIQTKVFKSMPQELQQALLVLDDTLAGSKLALTSWERSATYRTTIINFGLLKDHRLQLFSAKITEAILLNEKVELVPLTYDDPYFESNLEDWSKDKIALEKERAAIAKRAKKMQSYNRGKNWQRKTALQLDKLDAIDKKIAAHVEAKPVQNRTTGYLVNKYNVVASAEIVDIKLRLLTIEGFDLPQLTQNKWLGIEGARKLQQAQASRLPLRQALLALPPPSNDPHIPATGRGAGGGGGAGNPSGNTGGATGTGSPGSVPPTKTPIPTMGNTGAANAADINLRASVGLLGVVLIGLNILNCVNTLNQANEKDAIGVNDVASIISSQAYLVSLLFSFKMGLWDSIKNQSVTITKLSRAGSTTTTENLINLAKTEWSQGGKAFEVTATEFVRYAKVFAIAGFIASSIESIQLAYKVLGGGTTSTGETVTSTIKLMSTTVMAIIAGVQVAALFGYASMTLAFGPWMMAATLVAALVYAVVTQIESYFFIEGFNKWLYHCCWGNNPKWNNTPEQQKLELRSAQELMLQPTVYSLSESDAYLNTGKVAARHIYTIFPPQLTNRQTKVRFAITNNGFTSDELNTGRTGERFNGAYQAFVINGELADYDTVISEVKKQIDLENRTHWYGVDKPAPQEQQKATPLSQTKSQGPKPIVWKTTIPLDDCYERYNNHLELEFIYPPEILAPRPDHKGYRIKVEKINNAGFKQGIHKYNNVEPDQTTDNELVIDGNNQVPITTFYFKEINDE